MSDLFDFLPESTNPAPPRQDVNTYMAETMPAKPATPAEPVSNPEQLPDAPPRVIVASDPPPPVKPRPEDFPGLPVASFSCYCGCLDEVLEPAPEWVTCWGKGCGQRMHRWYPKHLPPSGNARQLTDEERQRI